MTAVTTSTGTTTLKSTIAPPTNGTHTLDMGSYGGPGANGARAPLPHIDDLTSNPIDIDMKRPLRTILELADMTLRQAEADRQFGRPDKALRGFIQASIIAIKLVPFHLEYSSVHDRRPDLKQKYGAIIKKIGDQHDTFEGIKAAIVEDNKRTGVSPTPKQSSSQRAKPAPVFEALQAAAPKPKAAPAPAPASDPKPASQGYGKTKPKPPVRPKPPGMHGKPIRPGVDTTAKPTQAGDDLLARFSNLRGPPKASEWNQSVPGLPKAPDAIYSPARGTVTETAASLPSSTRGGLFTRTPSTTTPAGNALAASKIDYFSPSLSSTIPKTAFTIPDGATITAEALVELMDKRARILVIDVRNREDFDDGHLNSQTIICIEPHILQRESVTSDDIEESMILAPLIERQHFSQRERFDLVVFYDQSSESVPHYIGKTDNRVLLALQRALTSLSFGKELRTGPKLLEGGLDAWTDHLGPQCLVPSSIVGSTAPRPRTKPTRPLGRPLLKYRTGNLRPDQIKDWDAKIRTEASRDDDAKDVEYARNLEEFHKKYPPAEAESMMSIPATSQPGTFNAAAKPATTNLISKAASQHAPKSTVPQFVGSSPFMGSSGPAVPSQSTHPPKTAPHIYPPLQSQPARPQPAVPKPSLSGLSDTNLEAQSVSKPKAPKFPGSQLGQRMTGLYNPGNWCYANSTMQSLRLSPGFGKELASKEWHSLYPLPKLQQEKGDHPRLMARIVANLFYWMEEGSFHVMKAQTLMDYSLSLCSTSGPDMMQQFGGPQQQDAQEFLSWLMDALHQETNTKRDYTPDLSGKIPNMANGKSGLQGSYEWWQNYSRGNQSIIDKYWRGLDAQVTTCTGCKTRSWRWTPSETILISVDSNDKGTLSAGLEDYIAPDTIDDYHCDVCKRKQRGTMQRYLSRLPDLLCIAFQRTQYIDNRQMKNMQPITWDLNRLDLEPYFIPASERRLAPGATITDRTFQGPYIYECYCIIMHQGSSTNSGHYYTMAREPTESDPNAWYKLNDSNITKYSGNVVDLMKKRNDDTAYLSFFRRKQLGPSGHTSNL